MSTKNTALKGNTPPPPSWQRRGLALLLAGSLKLMHQLQEAARESKIPRGVGPLTFEILRREVGDWGRFNNWRQVSIYTGLCAREQSSGGERRSGSEGQF